MSAPGRGAAQAKGPLYTWLFAPTGALAGCPVTRFLMVANALVFVGEILTAGSLNAVMGVPETVMLAFGGNYTPATVGEWRLEALIASCFLHFSILHLGFNLYALRQVGPFVERAVGPARFLPMYLLSGIVGNLASTAIGMAFNPERLSAGASGAICGAIGAALALGGRTQGWKGPIVRSMGFWLVATFVIGLQTGGTDNAAHAGGALSGMSIALLWKRGVIYKESTVRTVLTICGALMVATAVTVIARDTLDPYATLDAQARIGRARSALNGGRCAEAARAVSRAANLSPRAELNEELEQLRGQVSRYCAKD